ncbi:MAG: hypothetical protein KEFWMYNX_000583 [Candidatus Fervidibacter sp.]
MPSLPPINGRKSWQKGARERRNGQSLAVKVALGFRTFALAALTRFSFTNCIRPNENPLNDGTTNDVTQDIDSRAEHVKETVNGQDDSHAL